MTQQTFIITGAIFGLLAIIFGAFGAHALKKTLTTDQLKSFETGVKYQMYHAIVLLVLGFHSQFSTSVTYWAFTLGILLFSFSIYGLVLSDSKGKKFKFLGPITPIGGLFFVLGWIFIIINSL
ncbi:DUF423 domain-containing protein [Flaviramulus sp. BrNp1-15]|uniref:DUF423 domain-containing protein n=1 Tax=Flaviramulus sp. BrNp1-15 TaxID=2916754 RepID=UPI001EE89D64|nr:DUF423 domain-containing protein [Flaviramulus sp. BrNp1-15]ULC60461.1 DUF423 domain-containing protein [Flaviramulus sp. BrNp1-15]